jgi:amino acid transporter
MGARQRVSESLGYRLKCALLGPPLVNSEAAAQRLPKRLALGVLASDCVSSSAYGSEEILRALVPVIGVAAFTLVLPVTGIVLVVLLLLTLAYRDVVMVYTKAGGSYVVARENFGPAVAQIAAVALLIDYTVTVAVQSSAGTDAVLSLLHLVGGGHDAYGLDPYKLELTVGVVLLLCYTNLRGLREAGRLMAMPFYLFAGTVGLVIVIGLGRSLFGELPRATPGPGAVPPGRPGSGWLYGATLFIVLRAFANGGSSLTGLEAISNGVSAFQPPEGRNARRTLVIMSCVLAFLVGGVSLLAHFTHAMPYADGSPTVIAQEARVVFGQGAVGTALFVIVQVATALILYTGGNTSFNGFPYLASFVAGDRFLPLWLTHRGHRLAFSNGIIVLTIASIALLIFTASNVDRLVAFYAIGVFTGFVMACTGLFRYHWVRREHGRAAKLMVTGSAAMLSAVVVLVFAVTKFTEGAWLVVVIFPLGVWALIRTNRRYRAEEAALAGLPGPGNTAGPPDTVLVLVDNVDLASVKALRYARDLDPRDLRVVHFVVDTARAGRLAERWSAGPGADVPLELIGCPDRRIPHAAAEFAAGLGQDVTVLLPRRVYPPPTGRLLHDRTADQIAHALSRIPGVTPLIVPFDVTGPGLR